MLSILFIETTIIFYTHTYIYKATKVLVLDAAQYKWHLSLLVSDDKPIIISKIAFILKF